LIADSPDVAVPAAAAEKNKYRNKPGILKEHNVRLHIKLWRLAKQFGIYGNIICNERKYIRRWFLGRGVEPIAPIAMIGGLDIHGGGSRG